MQWAVIDGEAEETEPGGYWTVKRRRLAALLRDDPSLLHQPPPA